MSEQSTEFNSYNDWRQQQGMAPAPAKEETFLRSLNLSDKAWNGIAQLALEYGFIRGRNPSRTAFLEALGQGLLAIPTLTLESTEGETQ